MNFSDALFEIKRGAKMTRTGWNGKDQFVFLVPGSTFQVNRAPLNEIYPEGTVINYGGHIDIRAANGEIRPWVASQSDLLSNDWEFYEGDV